MSILIGSLGIQAAWPQAKEETSVIPQKSFISASTKKIPYKPIAQKDAKGRFIDSLSGKSYGPDDYIDVPKIDRPVSLKPGVTPVRVQQPAGRMKAEDYYAQLEEIERYLSSKGYSLREEKSLGTLERYDAKYSRLEADAKKLRADSRRVTSIAPKATMLSIDRFKPHSGVVDGEYVEYTGSRSYNKEIGSPDAMSVWWRTSMEGTRNIDPEFPFTKFHTESTIGQTIFGYQCIITKATATSWLDETGGKVEASLELAIAPPLPKTAKLWDTEKALKKAKTVSLEGIGYDKDQTIFTTSFYVQAGPVPVTITLSLIGNISLDVKGDLSIADTGTSRFTVEPSVSAIVDGSAQAGVKALVAIGFGVNLNALTLGLPITQTIDVAKHEDPLLRKITSSWDISAEAEDILKGYMYLAFSVLAIDFNIELFNWDGFSFTLGTLFKDAESLVPGSRKPDPALTGMSYIKDKGTISVDVVNWGGAVDWKGYSLRVTNQEGKGTLSIPIATINRKGELDSTVAGKEGRVTYVLSQKEMQILKLPLTGSARILGEILIPSGGIDLHKDNNKFSITVKRSVDLVVSSLEHRSATKKPAAPEAFALSLTNGTDDPVTWADLAEHLTGISFTVNGKTYTIRGADLLKEFPSELTSVVGTRTPLLIPLKSLGIAEGALDARPSGSPSTPAPGKKVAPAPSSTTKPAPSVAAGSARAAP